MLSLRARYQGLPSTDQPSNQEINQKPNPCLVSESLLSKLIAQTANSALAVVSVSVSEFVSCMISTEGEDVLTQRIRVVGRRSYFKVRKSRMMFWLGRRYCFSSEILLIELADGYMTG